MSYEIKSKRYHEERGRELFSDIFEKEASAFAGALAGSAIGAGIGYTKSDKNKTRNALNGAGAGGLLGAGAGKVLGRSGGSSAGGGSTQAASKSAPIKAPTPPPKKSGKAQTVTENVGPTKGKQTASSQRRERLAKETDEVKELYKKPPSQRTEADKEVLKANRRNAPFVGKHPHAKANREVSRQNRANGTDNPIPYPNHKGGQAPSEPASQRVKDLSLIHI